MRSTMPAVDPRHHRYSSRPFQQFWRYTMPAYMCSPLNIRFTVPSYRQLAVTSVGDSGRSTAHARKIPVLRLGHSYIPYRYEYNNTRT
jgi:hypothetical protein